MRRPEQISLESVIDAVRKPVALVAFIATLAAGVALETPAVAGAHGGSHGTPGMTSGPDVRPKASAATEHDGGDNGPEIALAAVAGIVIVGGAALTLAERVHRR